MREILFRGKRTDNGEWVYGYYCPVVRGGFPATPCIVPDIDGMWEGIPIIPETVGQYTGLIDKNGKRIFEGDIVTYVEEGIRGDFSQGVMEIVWTEKTAKFCGRTKQYSPVEIANSKNLIGNIYDNPELLEVSE
jgi:hypothetical protein